MPVTEARAREIVAEEFTRWQPNADFAGFTDHPGRWGMTQWPGGYCKGKRADVYLCHNSLLFHDEDQVRDTVRHEIAHALVGADAGHGPIWKAAARRVGCSPKAKTDAGSSAIWLQFKWVAQCSHCEKPIAGRHRLTEARKRKVSWHRPCGQVLGRIRWVESAVLAQSVTQDLR